MKYTSIFAKPFLLEMHKRKKKKKDILGRSAFLTKYL